MVPGEPLNILRILPGLSCLQAASRNRGQRFCHFSSQSRVQTVERVRRVGVRLPMGHVELALAADEAVDGRLDEGHYFTPYYRFSMVQKLFPNESKSLCLQIKSL
ncbi:MAG: hypothetical protein LR015_06780 [Verrucomicrobia bacterium]|nr:hypothetical protein [Verrucomicrobiota bacterium]